MNIFAQIVSSLIGGIVVGIAGLQIGSALGFPVLGDARNYTIGGIFFVIAGISIGSILGTLIIKALHTKPDSTVQQKIRRYGTLVLLSIFLLCSSLFVSKGHAYNHTYFINVWIVIDDGVRKDRIDPTTGHKELTICGYGTYDTVIGLPLPFLRFTSMPGCTSMVRVHLIYLILNFTLYFGISLAILRGFRTFFTRQQYYER